MPSVSAQWRSLSQLADDPDFIERARGEFPALQEPLTAPHDRRSLLQGMAATLAASGFGGCDAGAPGGTLVPAVKAPPNVIPGRANRFATAHVLNGYATGVIVTHQMGRPISIAGNPKHPASLGGVDVFSQAQLLGFYNGNRATTITAKGLPTSEQNLLAALADQRAHIAQRRGNGFRILTGAVSSPTRAAQIDQLLSLYPEARWHQWEALSRERIWQGTQLAYGRIAETVPNMGAIDVLLAIDGDLLDSAPGHLRFAREFASRRNPVRTQKMSRLYAIELTPTLTGSVADHRFVCGPRDLPGTINALAASVLGDASVPSDPHWLKFVIEDLKSNQGRAFLHVGPDQPAQVHALAHAVNEKVGKQGTTFHLIQSPIHGASEHSTSLKMLVDDMQAGKVTSLLIIDCDPCYAAPHALGFSDALKRVPFSLSLSVEPNETSQQVLWAIPMYHPLESWSDARAFDGTASILQPQALPLYTGISCHRMLALFAGSTFPGTFETVQGTWKKNITNNFADAWQSALANGVIANTAATPLSLSLQSNAGALEPPGPPDQPLTLLFRPDPYLWDGRFASNAWLQELPRPLTKLTWDNPLLVAPEQARMLNLENGDLVRLSLANAKSVTAPVWIMPGQARDCVVALLGFGRQQTGTNPEGGTNFYPLTGYTEAAALQKLGGRVELASTEHHDLILDRPGQFARHRPLSEYEADPNLFGGGEQRANLYRWKPEGPAAWAMSIDLNACIGCNACVLACQVENNIPVVGKAQVLRQREMHWLRIDRYYEGNADSPATFFQPILCMHCEQAPCEVVCPVGATVHDSEGLNVMVYNRCVGTRFCSNNCPYKVRRFNYFAFAREERRPPEARNPDVTVRARGVMEKCTFCIQRIAEARIAADLEARPVGEVRTACQAACPTQAFSFGNLADPHSEVVKHKQSPLTYALLADQNTHPRVTYEARIDNPNPFIDRAPTND